MAQGSEGWVLIRAWVNGVRKNTRVDAAGTVRQAKDAILAAHGAKLSPDSIKLSLDADLSGEVVGAGHRWRAVASVGPAGKLQILRPSRRRLSRRAQGR